MELFVACILWIGMPVDKWGIESGLINLLVSV